MPRRRVIFRVVYRSIPDGWWVLQGRRVLAANVRKHQAVTIGRGYAKREWSRDKTWSQLVVHGRNGRIQYEHTYPRSSDPKRSKG